MGMRCSTNNEIPATSHQKRNRVHKQMTPNPFHQMPYMQPQIVLKTDAPRIQSRSVYEKDANDPSRSLRKFKDSNSKTDTINHFDLDPGTHTNANVMDHTNEFAAKPFIT